MRGTGRSVATAMVAAVVIGVAAIGIFANHGTAGAHRGGVAVARGRAATAYGQLPLAFVPNRGQSRGDVRVLAQGDGFAAGLTEDGLLLSLSRTASTERTLRLRFLGARAAAPVAERRLPGRVSYLAGSDRRHWQTGIPMFAKAGYRDLWPGIDATLSGRQRQLEYTFTLAPGADPGRIQLGFDGQTGLRLAADGSLRLSAGGGLAVRQLAPRAYQLIGGHQVAVGTRYALHGDRVMIDVGNYDHGRALVIDPTVAVAYSTYLGGGDSDQASAIAVDGAGEAFVTGTTSSTDFATSGAVQTTNHGNVDAFVTKLSADGTKVLYTTYLGGGQEDDGNGIAVDATGDAYVAGFTKSNDFPIANPLPNGSQPGEQQPEYQSGFVSKLNPSGTSLDYSTYLGGCCFDSASAIAVDSQGAAYVTGQTRSFDFPGGNSSPSGNGSAFVTKIGPSDTLVYTIFLGSGGSTGNAIAVDGQGRAWVAGVTGDTGFPLTANAYVKTLQVDESMGFVTELSAADDLLYSTYLGGTSESESANGITVDANGNAFVTGTTAAGDFPTKAALQTTFGGSADAFVTEFHADGSVAYSTYLGGTGDDEGRAIAVDGSGQADITGATTPVSTGTATVATAQMSGSGDFPLANPTQPQPGGNADAFVSGLAAGGASLSFSTYLGGGGSEAGSGIAVDPTGNAYVAGFTQSADFPTDNAQQSALKGTQDGFVTKFGAGSYQLTAATTGAGTGTVTSAPAGIDCGAVCAASFPAGSAVTLTATATGGSTFGGWSGACTGTQATCVVAMSAAQTVTATFSAPAATSTTVTASGGHSVGVPVNIDPPVISGTPLPGNSVHCSTGTWTNTPTGYTYLWKLAGVPIPGATGSSYVVRIADEASGPSDALTCVVTASNGAGAGAPATSKGVLVAVAGTSRCPAPTGELGGSKVGVLRLGMTKVQARHRLTRFNVTQNKFDNFCLYAGWGIRVAYPSAPLLRAYPHKLAKRISGRIVIALTANPFYKYKGTPPGTALSVLARRVKLAKPFHIGLNYWYIVAARPSNAIFKVRDAVVQEVGLVSRPLTGTRADQKRLLNSFKNG